MRWSIFIGILAIIAGVIFMVASSFPSVAKIVATPFCEDVKEENFRSQLTCINGENEQNLSAILIGIGTTTTIGGSLIIVLGIVGSLMLMSARMNHILRNGEPAEATILDMQHTGVRVNSQPMLKFRLQVQPTYGASYEAETQRIIPFGMMGHLMLGMAVPVKYDPRKPEMVALDFDSMRLNAMPFEVGVSAVSNAESQASLTERLRELEDSYQAGLINQEEYEDARKRILSDV
jgi:hypothetical protein